MHVEFARVDTMSTPDPEFADALNATLYGWLLRERGQSSTDSPPDSTAEVATDERK